VSDNDKPTPLFADGWYKEPRVQELRQEIQNVYRAVGAIELARTQALAAADATGGANVRAFGALGDGVADDTAAFALALAASPAVYVPPGVYLVDRLAVPAGASIRGAGRGSVLRLPSQTITDDPDFGGVLNVYGTPGTPITGVYISDLMIDGNRAGLTIAGTTNALNIEAVDVKDAQRCTFHALTIVNAMSDGIDIDDSSECLVSACHLSDCGGFGVHMSNGALRNRVTGCIAEGCGIAHSRGGFDTHNAATSTNNSFVNCLARNCYQGFLVGGGYTQLIGCTVSGTTVQGINVNGPHAMLSGCMVINAGETPYRLNGEACAVTGSIVRTIPSGYGGFRGLAADVIVTGCIADTGAEGFRFSGARAIVTSCIARNITTTPFSVTGTGSVEANNITAP
jgi:parallel beta-helix repeat protein